MLFQITIVIYSLSYWY